MRLISIEITAINILRNRGLIEPHDRIDGNVYMKVCTTIAYRQALIQSKYIWSRARAYKKAEKLKKEKENA